MHMYNVFLLPNTLLHYFLFLPSCNLKLNLDYLLEKLWDYLNLIQVFTKKRGQKPDLDEGIILRNGSTVEHICHSIHRSLASQCKYALVWVRIVEIPVFTLSFIEWINSHFICHKKPIY
ncbi:Developmentally-regulated GTP-binding protein 2 [Schistosoma haematobium]|uniref:Developmentally-regulated GTP-binding protein 2 n=1 Tax=Schistosoma haematobium TaxID=6185 RepID=A0A922LP23_SCHHA|nr:Developmentally-regulated GTP-binding protein 2 [Schistosoma haematobium]KAH9590739.1 Developmentally-regulated GTP-binding protein 2 [Schistosoma haematobium]